MMVPEKRFNILGVLHGLPRGERTTTRFGYSSVRPREGTKSTRTRDARAGETFLNWRCLQEVTGEGHHENEAVLGYALVQRSAGSLSL
jgi:hypothetical protein